MKKYLGKNLLYLRINKGLKQAQMYNELGIKASTWGMYEIDKSQPNLDVLISISKYFDVSETDLLHSDLEANANLIEKNKDDKKHENANLIANQNANRIEENSVKLLPATKIEIGYKHSLNEPETTYKSLRHQVEELSIKVAKIEANMSKRIAQMEDKIKALDKDGPKK